MPLNFLSFRRVEIFIESRFRLGMYVGIGRANLVAKIVTTENHVFFYTITMGAVVLSRHFSSSRAPMSDPNKDLFKHF